MRIHHFALSVASVLTTFFLLSPEAREYYELETLWGDGARIDWGGAEPQVAPASGPVLHEATDDVG